MNLLQLLVFGLFLLIISVGMGYTDSQRNECKLKAVNESHMSIDDAKKLCSP